MMRLRKQKNKNKQKKKMNHRPFEKKDDALTLGLCLFCSLFV